MSEQYIVLDNSRFTTLIIDPTVILREDRPFYCPSCAHLLFKMNRKFAVIADGVSPLGGMNTEVPLNIFRMTRMCGPCRHYYIVYFDGESKHL